MQLKKSLDLKSISYLDNAGNVLYMQPVKDLIDNALLDLQPQLIGHIHKLSIRLPFNQKKSHFIQFEFDWNYTEADKLLCNGFQSWTESKHHRIGERIPKLRSILKPIWSHYKMQFYGNYRSHIAKKEKLHSYNFAEIKALDSDLKIKTGDKIFGVFVYDINKSSLNYILELGSNKKEINLDFVYGFDLKWSDLFGEENTSIKANTPPLAGWCSWYNFYENISEALILEQVQNFINQKIPLSIFQIDDGWQQAIGDWTENKKFPSGLKKIAQKIKSAAYVPGIWVAPFIVEHDAQLIKDHPEWIRKDQNGKSCIAGYNPSWSGIFYCLEWRLTEVQNYLKQLFYKLRADAGFEFFKLDFLYAVTIGAAKPKLEEMQDAMEFLKSILSPSQMLACGVPLKNCHGITDYCRVSGDVALVWEDLRLSKALRYRERVSTYGALRSTITRTEYNKYGFGIDPDVYILRNENHKLNKAQKETLYLINQVLGSLLFNSDDISKYDDQTRRKYLMQFPLRTRQIKDSNTYEDTGWVLFSSHDYDYILVYNLSSQNARIDLPRKVYHEEGIIEQLDLSPYSSKITMIIKNEKQLLMWSDGHIFPGNELKALELIGQKLNIELDKDSKMNKIKYVFKLPNALSQLEINGQVFKSKLESGMNIIRYSYIVDKVQC